MCVCWDKSEELPSYHKQIVLQIKLKPFESDEAGRPRTTRLYAEDVMFSLEHHCHSTKIRASEPPPPPRSSEQGIALFQHTGITDHLNKVDQAGRAEELTLPRLKKTELCFLVTVALHE